MASKTLYLYKSVYAAHQSLYSGGEFSVSSDSTSSSATHIGNQVSVWFDASPIANLDIKTINSVTFSFQCKASKNTSINYSYFFYKLKVSGVDGYKLGEIESSKLPTSWTPITHTMRDWTKAEICAGDGVHLYLDIYMAVPWLNTSTAYLKDVKLIVDYTLNSYKITVKANNDAGGTVSGDGTYESGSTISISASPKSGYKFVKWSDGNTNATRSVTVTANTTYTAQFERTTYTISTYAENGTVSGGGAYEYGTSAMLTAIPNNGYKFSHWLIDGVTSGSSTPISISVTKDTTVTAVFQKMAYVTYDSILNFQQWKDNGILGSNAVVSNITNIGFTLTSNDGVNEGTASSPFFKVEAGESYKIDIDIKALTPTEGSDWDIYIFFCDENGNWIDFVDGVTNRYSETFNNTERIFTAPNKSEVVKAQIRCDANGSNNTVLFSNFRIYPAKYEYMGDSITAEHAEQRSNCGQWNMPIPERAGYNFIGWNTKLDGGGIFYTENSAFPTEDTILYSQWEVITLPEINSVQITPNPCNAGQGFIISVGFTE